MSVYRAWWLWARLTTMIEYKLLKYSAFVWKHEQAGCLVFLTNPLQWRSQTSPRSNGGHVQYLPPSQSPAGRISRAKIQSKQLKQPCLVTIYQGNTALKRWACAIPFASRATGRQNFPRKNSKQTIKTTTSRDDLPREWQKNVNNIKSQEPIKSPLKIRFLPLGTQS